MRIKLFFSWGVGFVPIALLLVAIAVRPGAKNQQRAVEIIRQYGGRVIYEDELEMGAGMAHWVEQKPGLKNRLGQWLGKDLVSSVVKVDISDAALTDDEACEILSLLDKSHLLKLTMYDVPVTDQTGNYLGNFANLRHLALSGTNITDSTIQSLDSLNRLENLYIARTKVTEALFRTWPSIAS